VQQYRSQRFADALVFSLVVVFAVYVRYAMREFVTSDFTHFTGFWYAAVQERGFAATGTAVSNYTPPYMYLLYLTSRIFPGVEPVAAIKIPSVAFDFVCAWFVYRIVALKYPGGRRPLFACMAVLVAPTVVCNSGLWGQADSIYAAMLLACVYFLMTGRAALATIAFGLGLSIKFQTMFMAPALCALWLRRVVPLWALLLVPLVYAVAMIPAWLAGRPALELATVYLTQSVTYHDLAKNAPTLYAWLPQSQYGIIVMAGLLLMVAIGCYFVWTVWKSKATMTPTLIMQLCLLSLIMTPFFLPKMHDRFFYTADVLAIAYAFYFPRQYYVAVAVSFASFFSYQPFLFHRSMLPLPLLSLVMFIALATVAYATREALRQNDSQVASS
jgi:Gpi18-like mannosyltransferase